MKKGVRGMWNLFGGKHNFTSGQLVNDSPIRLSLNGEEYVLQEGQFKLNLSEYTYLEFENVWVNIDDRINVEEVVCLTNSPSHYTFIIFPRNPREMEVGLIL